MELNLQSITGFSCSDNVIDVKNKKGKGLYYFANPKGRTITFNLIPGKWFTKNELKRLDRPVKFVTPELDKPELNRPIKPFKFRVGDNPNKCTIDFSPPDYVDIFIDKEIANQAIPFFVFVMFHENGHFFYGGKMKGSPGYYASETKCDKYACKQMLEMGFNPSQCLFAIELCLSENKSSRTRKDNIFSWLKKVRAV